MGEAKRRRFIAAEAWPDGHTPSAPPRQPPPYRDAVLLVRIGRQRFADVVMLANKLRRELQNAEHDLLRATKQTPAAERAEIEAAIDAEIRAAAEVAA